ncbi:hypothetical protein [Gemmata sp.]|uniref:hypothetical protein n=1 Tax=Gemmata sp. TaxID=1914242 RepID=UPI003F726685
MAALMQEVEVWVMVNDQGEYVAHADPDKLAEVYAADVGELADAGGLRRVKLTVNVPLPEPFELRGEVKVEEAAGDLKAA